MKSLVISLLLLATLSCGQKHPVLTQTQLGEPVTMQEIKESASRRDIPENVKPHEVVAKVETKTGAKAWVVKKTPFSEPIVFQNEQARKEGLTVAQPKDPWWKVYALILVGILLIVVIVLWILNKSYNFSPINSIKKFIKLFIG